MNRMNKMILICTAVLAAVFLAGFDRELSAAAAPPQRKKVSDNKVEVYPVKTVLRELFSVDPEKRIGVYGRYTELTAEDGAPDALLRVIAEVNARAKETVEAEAERFLAENRYRKRKAGSGAEDHFRYHNVSCIVNVTRADSVLFSILEAEMISGIGEKEGDWLSEAENCRFRASVYDTQSGMPLTPADFLTDPGSLPERLEAALENKYALEGLYTDGGKTTPAWTADYLGLRFYFDAAMIPEEKKNRQGMDSRKAVHVSIPYTALDGPMSEAAAAAPESFIAQLEKNTDYRLPHDSRSIRIEKALNSGYEAYRIVISDGKEEKAWWLEYADDNSDYFVFRTMDGYYFYRLDDTQDRAYVYNFARPDGGFDRFENQNAQCFDSFLHGLNLAVPYHPGCVHMRERTRRFMDSRSGLNTSLVPNGHYCFLPEPGRGRTWLHFSLIDDALALDSRNVGCRLLHEVSASALDEEGNAVSEITIPAGEVLRFLRVSGESELYYYMSPQYSMYTSGARDYFYDCGLSDGRKVRLSIRSENNFFVDGMYMDRIGEPVTLGAAQYEAGFGKLPDHYVTIAGKEYPLIQDLSLMTNSGEEIDFGGDVWWIVENYVGTYIQPEESGQNPAAGAGPDAYGDDGADIMEDGGPAESGLPEDAEPDTAVDGGTDITGIWDPAGSGGAKLVISESGDVRFEYDRRVYTGKLPEKRFYREDVVLYMESNTERRSFRIIVMDHLPAHDPSFTGIRFYSAGEPATNEPSHVPPIDVKLVRQ